MHSDRSCPPRRRVVLHADDYGMHADATQGILRGFTHGLLTSTSALANAPDCSAALDAWKLMIHGRKIHSIDARQRLGDAGQPFEMGIHLNLTQGRPLTGSRYPEELLDRQGRFPGIFKLYHRLAGQERRYRAAIAAELESQIQFLLDHGLPPTHLNGHQYVELLPTVSAVIPRLLIRYSIPVVRVAREPGLFRTTLLRRFQVTNWFLGRVKRSFATRFLIDMQRFSVPHPHAFFGTSHAGQIDLGLIRQFLSAAGPAEVTEIGLHPGMAPGLLPLAMESTSDDVDGWHDPLAARRCRELELLTSPQLVELLAELDVNLGRLSDLPRRAAA